MRNSTWTGETRDAGRSWAPRGDGLPDQDAYLTVLREAFDRAGDGAGFELYFGATSGDVFASGDAGATWATAATRLPPTETAEPSPEAVNPAADEAESPPVATDESARASLAAK